MNSASTDLLSAPDSTCTQSMLCEWVLWKQKLMQLNKRADKEPTEVALEDWGISLIICFTVPAYKAVCVSAAAAPICPDMCLLVIHLQALRDRNREETVQCLYMHKLNELASKFNYDMSSELGPSLQKQQQKGGQRTAFIIAYVIYELVIVQIRCELTLLTLRCLFSRVLRHTPKVKVRENLGHIGSSHIWVCQLDQEDSDVSWTIAFTWTPAVPLQLD